MRPWIPLLLAAWLLAGCEDEGPFERAGEGIDEAAEDIRTEGETIRNQLDDAADAARERLEEAAEAAEERL